MIYLFKKKSIVNSISIVLFAILFSCDSTPQFQSNFVTSQARTWIGPEYWANPLQDWQVKNGKLECLVSKKNRNVHVLTKKLDTINGDLNMRVKLQVFNVEPSIKGVNWVGFSIGSKGEFNDYRDNAVFGKGLNIGITTNGNLFIDELPKTDSLNLTNQKLLLKGAEIKIKVREKDNQYELHLSLIDSDSNTQISQLTKSQINAKKLIGDLVLVSDYSTISNSKSVAFENWTFSGSKISTKDENAFGPILFSQYTLSRGTLKLTAQMAPVDITNEKVHLQIKENNNWETISSAAIDQDARTVQFRIEDWNTLTDIPYRISYKMALGGVEKVESFWEGTITKEPFDKEEIVIAGFTGNDHLGFPNSDITSEVEIHNPDVLFFSGDQLYEPSGGYGVQRKPHNKAVLDYLRKWYMYGWAYRDLMKNRPTVSITDDHDVYHGNIWGEGGRSIPKELGQGAKAQDYGGYKMPAPWVKMVERTQTSHLPDPFDQNPVAQGIGTYFSDMAYGGISFAILEDRKFKSAPAAILPKAKITNGWVQNKMFNVEEEADVKGAKLLGDRQLKFLNSWSVDWSHQSEMKVLLSQTIFANVATLPKEAMSGAIIPSLRILNKGEYPPNDYPVADFDSNGWPQTGRNKAVKAIRKGFAFHLAGDQHLGSTIQYGVDEWNDSGFALCVPSIANHWPRRWYPYIEGVNRNPDKPKYTGEFKDGFGNKMTVHAVSNPLFTGNKPSRLYDRAAGYGIIKLNKKNRNIIVECWPRRSPEKLKNNEQYEGWPIKLNQEDNYGRQAKGFLPQIVVEGIEKPVIQIINEKSNEIVYSLRLHKNNFKPKVFDISTTYTIKIGEPDKEEWKTLKAIKPGNDQLFVKF